MLRSALRILGVIVGGFAALFAALFVWLYFATEPSKDEVASVISPDGKFVAKLIEINGGATTSFEYLVTVAEAGTFSKAHEAASLYGAVRNASAYGANLRWTSPREVTVEYLDAKSSELLLPKFRLSNAEVTVVLRPEVTDAAAPAGGMLYNLQGRRQ